MNSFVGVVATLNVQGAAWDRLRRKFCIHNSAPPVLVARVRPSDVPPLAASGACLFALYRGGDATLSLVGWQEELAVELSPGGSDVVAISPVLELEGSGAGVRFAPLGLAGMLNAGGAVLGCTLEPPIPATEPLEDGWADGSQAVSSSGSSSGDGNGSPVSCNSHASPTASAPRAVLTLRGAGAVLAYASCRPSAVFLGGESVHFTYNEASSTLDFELPAGNGSSSALMHECVVTF